MADTLLLNNVRVLGVHRNENRKDPAKPYLTAYCFVPGEEEGYEAKPQVFEMSVPDEGSLNFLKKNQGQPLILVAEKTTYKDGQSRVVYVSELNAMLKNSPSKGA